MAKYNSILLALFLAGCFISAYADCSISGSTALNTQWTANGATYYQWTLTLHNGGTSNIAGSSATITLTNVNGYDTAFGMTYSTNSGTTYVFALSSSTTLYAGQDNNGQGLTVTSSTQPTFSSGSCSGQSSSSSSSSGTPATSPPTTPPSTGGSTTGGSPTCFNPQGTLQSGTCCANYCSSDHTSQDCSGCGGNTGSGCTRVNNEYCQAGSWSLANEDTWFVSRSTHYGFTEGGACGFGAAPNCFPGQTQYTSDCANVPSDLQTNDMAGMYAAPQGDYYLQTGGYLSCGECFQIQCRDTSCYSITATVTVQIVDSCPCEPNAKWCCDVASHCGELQTDNTATDGGPHCASSMVSGGQWNTSSIHLDLSDAAFNMLTTGSKTGTPSKGVVNTVAKRVPCSVVGNIYIRLVSGVAPSNSGCTNCYYYFSFVAMNAAYGGGFVSVQMGAATTPGGSVTWLTTTRNSDAPSYEPQNAYGSWNPASYPIYAPFQFRFTDAGGQTVTTGTFSSFAACTNNLCYHDTGVQFTM